MARYKKYTVNYGDTVQSIAQGQAGDVSFWHDIISYNKLEYPYIVDTVAEKMKNPEGLVTFGDSIIIPIEVDLLDTDVDALGNRDRELILSLALGRDLSMTDDEDYFKSRGGQDEIFSLSANDKGDVQTTSGVVNLKQAILARLLTPRGSLLLHPTYGSNINDLIGKRATLDNLVIIEDEIVATIKKDSRVRTVNAESSYIEEGTYHGEFTVYLHSLQEYFSFVVQGDANGQIALF